MSILVLGGSGFIGQHLCQELVERGHDVTAASRSPDVDGLPGSVQTVAADVTDPDTLDIAFEGQDAAVNLVSPSPLMRPRGGYEVYDHVTNRGTANCIQAAIAHGVDRFVQQSALGADPAGPTHYIRAKGRAEKHLRDSTLDWTIVQPSVVIGDGCEFVPFVRKLTPPLLAPMPGGGRHTKFQPLHVDAMAAILAEALEDDSHIETTYEVGGPSVYSLREVAQLVRRARGQPVVIVPVPMVLTRIAFALGEGIPGFPMGTDQYRSLRFDNTCSSNDVAAFGIPESEMKTLETYLETETMYS